MTQFFADNHLNRQRQLIEVDAQFFAVYFTTRIWRSDLYILLWGFFCNQYQRTMSRNFCVQFTKNRNFVQRKPILSVFSAKFSPLLYKTTFWLRLEHFSKIYGKFQGIFLELQSWSEKMSFQDLKFGQSNYFPDVLKNFATFISLSTSLLVVQTNLMNKRHVGNYSRIFQNFSLLNFSSGLIAVWRYKVAQK